MVYELCFNMQSRKWHPLAGRDIPRHVNNQAKREPELSITEEVPGGTSARLQYCLFYFPQLLRETDYRILPVMSVICSLRSFTGRYKTASIDEMTRHAATFNAVGAARSTAAPQHRSRWSFTAVNPPRTRCVLPPYGRQRLLMLHLAFWRHGKSCKGWILNHCPVCFLHSRRWHWV